MDGTHPNDVKETEPRHRFEQDLLLEVSQAVSSTLDLEVLLQTIADGTARLVGVETAAVYTIEDENLFLGATTPPLDAGMPESLRWAHRDDLPHLRRSVESRKPLVLLDARQAELSSAERVIVEVRNLRSLLFLPFCLEDEPIGVLILGTTSGEHEFDDHEISLCRTLTNQLAVSVQNARLHTGLKKYAAELETQMAEQERLAEQLRHAQKMEAVGRLAGGVAHDFNNLLQVVHGFTSLAREGVEPVGNAHKFLGFVLEAAERAALLVRQLLAFGRRQVLDMAVVDVSEIIEELMPMLRPVVGEHIAIECRYEVPLGHVEADRNQVEQILINLCINARDAMPEGGSLVISTNNVEVDQARASELGLPGPGSHVLLEVVDSGCGMTAETMARVFEPFFTTKGQGEGSGLGLATVHGLVTQHGGAIHIHSEVGSGTRVSIHLPVTSKTASERALEAPRRAPTGCETILVAEDDPLVHMFTRAVLEEAGYTVLSATTGAEAVAVVDDRGDSLDLALLDVVMPVLGGKAVFHHLCKCRPGIPVVFTSGYGEDMLRLDCDGGRVALVQKPYARDDLLRKIRELLDRPG